MIITLYKVPGLNTATESNDTAVTLQLIGLIFRQFQLTSDAERVASITANGASLRVTRLVWSATLRDDNATEFTSQCR